MKEPEEYVTNEAVQAAEAVRDASRGFAEPGEILQAAAPLIVDVVIADLKAEFMRERDEQIDKNIDNANAMHYALDVVERWAKERVGDS